MRCRKPSHLLCDFFACPGNGVQLQRIVVPIRAPTEDKISEVEEVMRRPGLEIEFMDMGRGRSVYVTAKRFARGITEVLQRVTEREIR